MRNTYGNCDLEARDVGDFSWVDFLCEVVAETNAFLIWDAQNSFNSLLKINLSNCWKIDWVEMKKKENENGRRGYGFLERSPHRRLDRWISRGGLDVGLLRYNRRLAISINLQRRRFLIRIWKKTFQRTNQSNRGKSTGGGRSPMSKEALEDLLVGSWESRRAVYKKEINNQ